MTEIPEHLLKRSRERRSALGLGGDDAGSDSGAATPTASAPAKVESAAPATPAGPAGRAAAPSPDTPPPPKMYASERSTRTPGPGSGTCFPVKLMVPTTSPFQ